VDQSSSGISQPDNVWDGYVQTYQLPKVGQGVDLIGPDDTIVHTICMGHYRFGVFNGVDVVAGDYGPEYMKIIASHIKNRRNCLFDSLVMVTGPERTGKSNFALQLARHIDPDFPLSSVCFKIDAFSKLIDESPNGSVIVFDEPGFDMFNQEWWASFQKELVKKLLVIGVKCLILILCIPHRMLLNAKLRERRVAFWIDVYTRGEKFTRGYAKFRRGVGNEWVEETYWEGLGAFRFAKLQGKVWDDYEVMKWEFVKEVSAGTYQPGSVSKNTKAMEERNLAIDELRRCKKTQLEIAHALNMDQSTISKILSREREPASKSESVQSYK
jgi:hypothetical protein